MGSILPKVKTKSNSLKKFSSSPLSPHPSSPSRKTKENNYSNISPLTDHVQVFRTSMSHLLSSSYEDSIRNTSDLCDKVDTSDLDTYILMNRTAELIASRDNISPFEQKEERNLLHLTRTSPIQIPNDTLTKKHLELISNLNLNEVETEQILCLECRKPVLRIKDDHSEQYCSIQCRYNSYNNLETIKCNYCSKEFIRYKLDKHKTFCSESCLEQGKYKVQTRCIDCSVLFHLELKYQFKILRCYSCHVRYLAEE